MGITFRYRSGAIAHEFFVKSSRDFANRDALRCGKGEILLCQKHPEYRTYSGLTTLAEGSWAKRFLRALILRAPISPHHLLTPAVWIAERLQEVKTILSHGNCLLGLQRRLAFFRGALRQAGSWRALQRAYGMRLAVLLYHNVAPLQASNLPVEMTISLQKFERQMHWLVKRGYSAIRPSQWLAWCREGTPLPDKPVPTHVR